MTTTITGTITSHAHYGVSANPLTIATSGAILASDGYAALTLASGTEWTVVNNGTVANNAAGAYSGGGIYATLATITNTGLIAGSWRYGISLADDATLAHSVIINSGRITDSYSVAGGAPDLYAAIGFMGGAGEVTNQNTGLISAVNNGILGYRGAGKAFPIEVTNLGTIEGGTYGIDTNGKLTLTNSGAVSGGIAGVIGGNSHSSGTNVGASIITNAVGGLIEGGTFGVTIAGNANTLVNAGTISGASAAVLFQKGTSDRLIDDPGAVFDGVVNGGSALGSTSISTLELATGSTTGTLSGLGVSTGFTNFAAITVDAGANWVLSGSNTLASRATLTDSGNLTLASSLAGAGTFAFYGTGVSLTVDTGVGLAPTIASFLGNTVALVGVHETIKGFGGGKLTLGGAAAITLAVAGSYSTTKFHAAYTSGETVITACYAAGTEIETEHGPVVVEHLHPGIRIRTTSGALRPLRWLGQRHHDAAELAAREELRPVRIAAGALGGGLPTRALRLSPEHALLLDGVLVPAIQLLGVPGVTQEDAAPVTYFHVELDTHDTILAEGTPAETYIDLASNVVFDNAATRPTPPATIQCAPRVTSGPILAAIRTRLGAAPTSPAPTSSELFGHIECATPGHIAGWASQPNHAPIRLLVAADGIPLGTALANGFRFDLHRAGLGRGAFAFDGPIPHGTRAIAITREADGTHLPGSPFQLA